MRLRDLCALSFFFSLVCLMGGLLMRSEAVLAGATTLAGLSYAGRDYFHRRPEAFTIFSVYAFFAAIWFGAANLAGYLAENGPYHNDFYKFDVREFQYTAQMLASLAVVVPLLTFDFFRQQRRAGWQTLRLPRLGFEVSDRTLLRIALSFLAVGWAVRYLALPIGWLGTLSSLVLAAPNVAILTLKLRWLGPRPDLPRWTSRLPFILMVVEVAQFTLFSNMRNTIIWPVVAYAAPYVLTKRLTLRRAAVGVALLLVFSSVFQVLGEVRGQVFGLDRISHLLEGSPLAGSGAPVVPGAADEDRGLVVLAARLSTFNQLTQVVRLVDEGGFYKGQTLRYLFYVFIPRIVWPDKPEVAPGQWFAEKIGRGQRLGARFSNAVNMTIPGELYLNFGWLGAIAGLALTGLIYLLFWEATAFHESVRNPIANLMAFGLLEQAMFTGAHFGGVVNMVLLYLAGLACGGALATVVRRRRRAATRRPAPVLVAVGRTGPPHLPPRRQAT